MIAKEPVTISPVGVRLEHRVQHVRRLLALVDEAEVCPKKFFLGLRDTLNLGGIDDPLRRKIQSWVRAHVEGEAALFVLAPLACTGLERRRPYWLDLVGVDEREGLSYLLLGTPRVLEHPDSKIVLPRRLELPIAAERVRARDLKIHPLQHVESAIDQHVEPVRL